MTSPKLLLADDSVTIRKVVELTFADEGIQVFAVADGETAMHKFVEIQPDMVIVDVNMPAPNGYQICEMIKEDPATKDIPVLLLVGSFEPFDQAEAARVGADGFMTKPFQSIRDLVEKVQQLLAPRTGLAQTVAETADIDDLYKSSFEDTLKVPPAPASDLGDPGMDDDMIEASSPARSEDEPDDLLDISYAEPAAQPAQAESARADEKTEPTSVSEWQPEAAVARAFTTQPLDEPSLQAPTSEPVFEDVPPLHYWSEDKTEPLEFVNAADQPAAGPETATQPSDVDAEAAETPSIELSEIPETARSEGATATPDIVADTSITPHIESSGDSEPVRSDAGGAMPAIEPEAAASVAESSKDARLSEFDWSAATPQPAETVGQPAGPETKTFEPRFVFDEPELLELSEPGEREFEASPTDKTVAEPEKPRGMPEPSPELVAAVARLVVEKLSDEVVREIAREVIPRIAENLIREALEDEHSN